ncbi:unnamed protein product, partial [marine sediment metagenome]
LNKLEYFTHIRKAIAKKYNESFEEIDEIITPFQLANTESSWHLYVVQLNLDKLNITRKEIFNELHHNNIGVQIHYIPVYYYPYYQQLGYKKGLCPNAEALYERIITIPLYPKMKDDDVKLVIDILKNIIEKHRGIP